MVLTNFESWAHGGSQPNNENISGAVGGNRRNLDLFNLSVIQSCHSGDPVQQCNNINMTIGNNIEPSHQQQNQTQEQQQILPPNSVNISHISSNGYYGFSQICSQQNNENAKKIDMEEDMVGIDDIIFTGGTIRKRLQEPDNNYQAKRCRFDDNDSQFDGFCQASFAPNSLTDLTMDHQSIQQQNIDQQLQQPSQQQNYMINSNLPESPSTTIYKSNNLQNSSNLTTSTNSYNDISRCMSSHMI